jgi:conjugal transfer pilus assembly protein TraL
MDKYSMPRCLDEPFKVAFLTMDEITVLIVPLLAGLFLFNAPFFSLCVGAGLVSLLKKLKGKEGHYFIRQLLYWYLPPLFRFYSTPPSHAREILG